MRFSVVNLGCKVNRVESDAACAQLIAADGEEGALEDADLIVVNTCIVTGEAEKKTRKAFSITRRFSAHSLPGTLHAEVALPIQPIVPA